MGSGASGLDMVYHLSKTATRITFSQNKRQNETKEERERRQRLLPSNVLLQDNVKRFTPTGAEFIDGSIHNFSVIIYATGIIKCDFLLIIVFITDSMTFILRHKCYC